MNPDAQGASHARTQRTDHRRPAVVCALLFGIAFSSYFAVQSARHAEQEQIKADEADKERNIALEKEERTLASEHRVWKNLYISTMGQADLAWKGSDIARTRELLQSQEPRHTGGDDLRGFEWHYLNRLCNASLYSWSEPEDVWCVAYSPDGRRIASASVNSLWPNNDVADITIRDAETGRVLSRLSDKLQAHRNSTSFRMTFSPDWKYVATTFNDSQAGEKQVKVWNMESGHLIATLAGDVPCAFSPDGQLLAYAAKGEKKREEVATIWDRLTQKAVRSFPWPNKGIYGLAFSPDGKRLAATRIGRPALCLWEVQSGKQLFPLATTEDDLRRVAFLSDGKQLVAQVGNNKIKVWDLATGGELRSFTHGIERPGFSLRAWRISRDGRYLASCAADCKLWDFATVKELHTYKGSFADVDFSPDGKRLVSCGGMDQTVKIWDATRDYDSLSLGPVEKDGMHTTRAPEFLALAFPESRNLAVFYHAYSDVDKDGKRLILYGLTQWDAATGERLQSLRGTFAPLSQGKNKGVDLFPIVVSPNGKYFADVRSAETAEGSAIHIWEAAGGKLVSSAPHNKIDTPLALTSDGKRLAMRAGNESTRSARVYIVDLEGGKERINVQTEAVPSEIRTVFSPDGRWLAVASMVAFENVPKPEIRLYESATGELVRRFGATGMPGFSIFFSRDSRRLASCGSDAVWVWDAATGETLQHFSGPASPFTPSAFNADCKRLAAVDPDNSVAIWDIDTGHRILTLPNSSISFSVPDFPPMSHMASLSFSPDDSYLVACYENGMIRVWDATPLPPKER